MIDLAEPAEGAARSASASGSTATRTSAAADVRDRVVAGAPAAARRGRRAGHRQGRGRRPADHLSGPLLRPAVADRGHRLRRPLRQGPAAEPARRRRGADLRRAHAGHAHLARPAAAGRLRPDAAGRRGRAAAAERRGAGGPDREPAARVHRAGRDRPAHGRAVQRPDHPRRRRLSGPAAGCRRGRDRRARRARRSPASMGNPAVALGVVKQSTANPLEVSAGGARRRCRRSAETCPTA